MNNPLQEDLGTRIVFGIVAALIAGAGVLVLEVLDFLFWNSDWVEADSLSEYVRKVWFVPVGISLLALFVGIRKGSEALEFAWDCWKD